MEIVSKIGLFIRSLIIATLILGVIPTSVSAKTVENKSVNGIVEEANPNSIEYYIPMMELIIKWLEKVL